MVTRIDKFTPEQEAAKEPHANKWIKKVLNTEPTDWEAFEKAAEECYGFIGVPWHGVVARAGSPFAVSYIGPMVALLVERRANASRNEILKAISPSTPEQIKDEIHKIVTETSAAVFKNLGVTPKGNVKAAELRDAVRNNWHHYLGGTFWLSWQAYTSFFREVCDLELPDDQWARDIAYGNAQQEVGWWWPNENFIIASNRPCVINTEETNDRGWRAFQLHSETGPALQYRDGWSVWAWHGVRVEQYVIESPEAITATDIINEENAEIARIKLERMGIDRFVDESSARILDEDNHSLSHPEWRVVSGSPDPRMVQVDRVEHRRLLAIDMPNDPDRTVTVVEVTCPSTEHRYLLRVPPHVKTCAEAVAWTADTKPEEYDMALES